MVADGDAAEYRGIGVNGDMVFDNRVAGDVEHVAVLVVLETLRAQRHALIQRHMVADDRCLTDHHARTVVDREVLPYLRPWMDVDARLRVGQLRDDTGDDGNFQFMQPMGHTVMRHRIHHRIAEDHLTVVCGSRVGIEHRLDIGIQQALDLWQRVDKSCCQPRGLLIHLLLCADFLAVLAELQSVGYLLREQSHQFLHVHTDIIRTDGLVGLTLVEVVGEDDALHQPHNLLHLFHRRQWCLYSRHHACLFLTDFRQ